MYEVHHVCHSIHIYIFILTYKYIYIHTYIYIYIYIYICIHIHLYIYRCVVMRCELHVRTVLCVSHSLS